MEADFDFSKGEGKIFIEGFHARVINGLLHLVLRSGEDSQPYIFPLDVAKKLARGLTQQIEEIETKNNIVIDGRLSNEPMPSPFVAEIKPPETPPGPTV